jgi:hypothetical protein
MSGEVTGFQMQLDDLRRRMGRAEDSLSGVLPKLASIESEQTRQSTEQRRQGVVLDDLHDESVGRKEISKWRRNALAWGVGLAVIVSAALSIGALLVTR